MELALPLEYWHVDLVTGDTLEVLTHGHSIEDGMYKFSLLFKGEPNVDVLVLAIPDKLVKGTRN